IVDCTPPGYGRDIELLRSVARRSGMHLVAATGTFCEQWSPVPAWVAASDTEDLAASFAAELARGCGVIKVATSKRMTQIEHTALRDAAESHRATGAPIVSHTTGGLGHEQLDVFEANGIDLGAVLVSHVCSGGEPPEYAVEISRRGAYVGFDRVGHTSHEDSHWLSLVTELASAGLLDRVLLSHDSVQLFEGPEAIA